MGEVPLSGGTRPHRVGQRCGDYDAIRAGCAWLNRIEPQFTALRSFTLDGTNHESHREQARMIRRYIAWRNRRTTDPKLRKVIKRASTIKKAKVA